MALDSRNARLSLVSLGVPFGRVLPHPDGAPLSDAGERAQLLGLYAGLALAVDTSDGAVLETVNAALTLLGEAPLESLDEVSDRGTVVRLHYPRARDALLRLFPWPFAEHLVELDPSGVVPAFGYGYTFALPADCLHVRAVGVGTSPLPVPVKRIGQTLVSNDPGPLQLSYTRRVTNPAAWDDLFADALVLWLAWRLAFPLTKKLTIAAERRKEAEAALPLAWHRASVEDTPDAVEGADVLLQVR